MSYPIQVTRVDRGGERGASYRNASPVDQVVTVEDGPDTPEAIQAGRRRTIRMLLRPGESRTVDVSDEAVMTHSTDTSSMRGEITLRAGTFTNEIRCEACRVTLSLARPALVSAEGEGVWEASVDGLSGTGLSEEEALLDLGMEVHSAVVMIAQEDDEKLTADARELKRKLLALVTGTRQDS